MAVRLTWALNGSCRGPLKEWSKVRVGRRSRSDGLRLGRLRVQMGLYS